MPVYDWSVDNTAVSVFDADSLSDIVLFLDFDGVFNPYRTTYTFKKEFYTPDSATFAKNPHGVKPKNYHFKFSSVMVDDVSPVFVNPSVSVVWLSTWREFTYGVMSDFGYSFANKTHYLPWGEGDMDTDHDNKYSALVSFLSNFDNSGRRFVWVDDLAFDPDDTVLPVNDYLLLSPDSDTGLSRDEVKVLKNFVND